MLNRNEREFVDRLDKVLKHIGSLTPANPADLRAIAENLPIATRSAKHLSSAIAALRASDWDSAEYHLGNAEGIVEPPPPCLTGRASVNTGSLATDQSRSGTAPNPPEVAQ